MKFHQKLHKTKSLIAIGLGLSIILLIMYITINLNNEKYYYKTKTNIKDLNTSLLNNVYIAKNDEPGEEVVQKESNDVKSSKNIEKNNNVEQKSNEQVIPASTTVENNTQQAEVQHTEGVYVGLKFTGSMTAYGKDCCGSDSARWGITSSGYDLKQSLTYNDSTYGSVRIVASDRNFKLYSIIKVDDPIDGSYNAIVLDRAGSAIGLNKTKKFDLAVESESYASSNYGVHRNISFEVLRVGK